MIAKLAVILNRWKNADYASQCYCKYAHANCLQFVCGVMDEMHDFDPDIMPPIPPLPPSTAIHSLRMAQRCHVFMQRRYPNTVIYRYQDETLPELMPGDTLTVRNGRNPGHVMLVGHDNRIWHCMTGCGVAQTAIGWAKQPEIYRVYRLHLMETADVS